MCADYFILAQGIPVPNVPEEVDKYKCSADKVKIIRSRYDLRTGYFKGLKNTFGLICVKGD